MSFEDLTDRQRQVYELLAEQDHSAEEIQNKLSISKSAVYDHISGMVNNLEDTEFQIGKTYGTHEQYTIISPTEQDGPVNATKQGARSNNVAKQTITKRANEFFAEIEDWKEKRNNYPQPVADGGLQATSGGLDLVFHVTDSHFGDKHVSVTRQPDGEEQVEEIFSSEIAENRIFYLLQKFIQWADELEAAGYTIDTVHLLLGGDIVTNEAIYDGQSWDVDETIKDQLIRAISVFEQVVARLSERFPTVQVVCQNGNHGEFRVDGSSGDANADDFLCALLDHNIRKSAFRNKNQYDNITFIMDEHEYYTNFYLRDGEWRGHLRHGQNTRGHIGTSSQQSLWGSWKDEHQFDLGFYGHNHQLKNEHYNGRRVFMGGTIAPPSEYAEAMGEFGYPCGYFLAVSDEQTWEKTEFVNLAEVY